MKGFLEAQFQSVAKMLLGAFLEAHPVHELEKTKSNALEVLGEVDSWGSEVIQLLEEAAGLCHLQDLKYLRMGEVLLWFCTQRFTETSRHSNSVHSDYSSTLICRSRSSCACRAWPMQGSIGS